LINPNTKLQMALEGNAFPRLQFFVQFLEFMLPAIVIAIPIFILFNANYFRPSLIMSWLFKWRNVRRILFLENRRSRLKALAMFWTIVLVVMACIPIVLVLCWGIVSAATLSPWIVGLTVIFLGLALVSLFIGVMRWWRGEAWRFSPFVKICLFCLLLSAIVSDHGGSIGSIVLFAVWEILALFPSDQPFSYLAVSSVFLSWNVLVVMYVIFQACCLYSLLPSLPSAPFLLSSRYFDSGPLPLLQLSPDPLADFRDFLRRHLATPLATANPGSSLASQVGLIAAMHPPAASTTPIGAALEGHEGQVGIVCIILTGA